MADKLRSLKDRASRFYAEGKLRDALDLYEEVISEEPRELACQIKVGDLRRRLGDKNGAVEAYAEVARRYADDGLLLKAIAVCKLILVADPDHTATQAMLADLYSRRRAGTAEVPSLPVTDATPDPATTGGVAWPSGVRMLDLDASLEPESLTPAVMSSWPMSQPVLLPRGQIVPIITGTPENRPKSIEESTLDIEITEAMREAVAPARLPEGDEQIDIDPTLETTLELVDVIEASSPSRPAEIEETFAEPIEVGAEVGTDEPEPALAAKAEIPLIPMFSELPKKAFVEILVRMKMHVLRRGETVIREGDEGDSFFALASGLVSVSRIGEDGIPVRLAHLGDGAFFGEMAMLQDGLRTATVKVEEDAQIFEISRELLEEVISTYPTVATAVRNFYRQRLLATAMATHALFAPFPQDERRALMEQFKSRSFTPGEVILEEGKKGNGLYLLLHGRVQVTRQGDEDAEAVVLAELSSGDLFGEMSLLTNQPTNATVTALEDAFVLRLSKKRFDELVLTNGTILSLVGELSERRAEANEKVMANQLGTNGAVLV